MMSDMTDHPTQEGTSQQGFSGEVDTDLLIDNLSYQEARNYVMQFLTAEKKTERLLQEKQQAFNKWNERLAFAEQRGTPEQVERVKHELHILIRERDQLLAERDALHRKNIILKEKLQLKATEAEASVSARAERLLTDFEQLVDVDEYKLQEAMKNQEAEDELAKLKARLNHS